MESSVNAMSSSVPVSEDSVGVFVDPLAFTDGNESEVKTRSESQGVFRQVVSLIFALFPESRPRDVKPVDSASWFRGFGDNKQRDPKVFLACFDRIRSIMSEVEDRMLTLAHGR